MKFRLGVGRTFVYEDGSTMRVQHATDVLELDVPDDGSEFVSTIWLRAPDGSILLQLPLALAPGLQDPAS